MRYYESYLQNVVEKLKGSTVSIIPGSALEGVTPESDNLGEVSDDIAKVLISEIKFYKNNVLPSIRHTFDLLSERTKEKEAEIAKGDTEIVPVTVPEPLLLETFNFSSDELYMQYSDIYLADKTAEEIRELTGDVKYLDGISDSKLLTVWEMYFKTFGYDNSNIQTCVSIGYLNNTNVDDIFIIYYILRGMLSKDYVEGTGSLSEFRDNRSKYYNYIKRNIAERIELLKNRVRAENIIITVRNGRATIVGDLYKPYLNSGGTVDALYGVIDSGSELISINAIINANKELSDAYRKAANGRRAKANSALLQLTNDGLLSLITNMVSEVPDTTDKNALYDEVEAYIRAMNIKELSKPIEAIESIYANVIYKESNLKTFLELFRVYSENSTAKLAITMTISDILASYLLTSVEITKD